MVALAITHATLSLRGLLEAFIWRVDADPAAYYANFAAAPAKLKNTIYVTNVRAAAAAPCMPRRLMTRRAHWLTAYSFVFGSSPALD